MDKQAQHESERAYLLTWKHVACQYADVLAVVAGVQLCLHNAKRHIAPGGTLSIII